MTPHAILILYLVAILDDNPPVYKPPATLLLMNSVSLCVLVRVSFVCDRCWMPWIESWRLGNIYILHEDDIDGFVQDGNNSSAFAMELLQSCTEPSIWHEDVFYITGPLWGECIGDFHSQRASILCVRFDKLLNKQSSGWWNEIPL